MVRCVDQPCVLETRGSLTKEGYRRIDIKIDGVRVTVMAHRLAWERANGRELLPWPHETVDHLCHNEDLSCNDGTACLHRQCIEPTHLEAVTALENWRRGRMGAPSRRRALTHCPKGHPYEGANLRVEKTGFRRCRTCHREAEAARRARM